MLSEFRGFQFHAQCAWTVALLAICFSLGALPALAAETLAERSELEFLAEQPLVLTPSRLLQPISEAPAAVTVIDRETIRATGYRDIGRLLRLVPGMQVGQERASLHWVTYHGLGNDNPSWMQVLIDGRSVFSPSSFGGIDWNTLPVSIDEIDRIEVVRGTHSVAYGANAFLGVINIITRHSTVEPGFKFSANAGNAHIRDLHVEQGWSTESGSLRLNAGQRHDTGFSGLHDGQHFTTASLRTDRRFGDHDDVMLRLAASSGARELGYADSTYGNNAERTSNSQNFTLHVQWRHAPRPDEEWLLHYYRNQDKIDEAWTASAWVGAPFLTTAYVPLDRNRESVRDNLELQYRLSLGETTSLLSGMELRQDRIDSPFLYYGAAKQSNSMARLFGQLDWSFRPDWKLNASLLAEKFSGDKSYLSPRLFANWQIDRRSTLRFGYARAWRQPTMFERYGDVRAMFGSTLLVHPYLPNPDLRPPRMDSLEIGYLRYFQAWDTRLDVRLFNERMSDYITRVSHPEYTTPLLSSTLPSARYENLGSAVTLRGIEYQIDSRPAKDTRLLFSHSIIDRRSADSATTRLTAPYTASLSWMQTWPQNWNSTLTLLRMGPLAGGTGFVPRFEYVSPAYTTLDARLARTLRLDGTLMEIAITATNLGGRHQEIADRSEQFLHGSDPVNRTSRMVWLSITVQPR
jgi:iron complex outermembrane receptor protein